MAIENDWTSTLEALKDSNKEKDILISKLLEDMVELESSLRHSKLALLNAYEDYRKKLEALQGQLKPRWWQRYLKAKGVVVKW